MSGLQKLIQTEKDAIEYGFAYPDYKMLIAQIIDECHEVIADIESGAPREKLQEEIGDVMHAALTLCLFFNFDADDTFEKTNTKFSKRMSALRKIAKSHGHQTLQGQSMDLMLKLWKEAKIETP